MLKLIMRRYLLKKSSNLRIDAGLLFILLFILTSLSSVFVSGSDPVQKENWYCMFLSLNFLMRQQEGIKFISTCVLLAANPLHKMCVFRCPRRRIRKRLCLLARGKASLVVLTRDIWTHRSVGFLSLPHKTSIRISRMSHFSLQTPPPRCSAVWLKSVLPASL